MLTRQLIATNLGGFPFGGADPKRGAPTRGREWPVEGRRAATRWRSRSRSSRACWVEEWLGGGEKRRRHYRNERSASAQRRIRENGRDRSAIYIYISYSNISSGATIDDILEACRDDAGLGDHSRLFDSREGHVKWEIQLGPCLSRRWGLGP